MTIRSRFRAVWNEKYSVGQEVSTSEFSEHFCSDLDKESIKRLRTNIFAFFKFLVANGLAEKTGKKVIKSEIFIKIKNSETPTRGPQNKKKDQPQKSFSSLEIGNGIIELIDDLRNKIENQELVSLTEKNKEIDSLNEKIKNLNQELLELTEENKKLLECVRKAQEKILKMNNGHKFRTINLPELRAAYQN